MQPFRPASLSHLCTGEGQSRILVTLVLSCLSTRKLWIKNKSITHAQHLLALGAWANELSTPAQIKRKENYFICNIFLSRQNAVINYLIINVILIIFIYVNYMLNIWFCWETLCILGRFLGTHGKALQHSNSKFKRECALTYVCLLWL